MDNEEESEDGTQSKSLENSVEPKNNVKKRKTSSDTSKEKLEHGSRNSRRTQNLRPSSLDNY